MTMFDTPEAKAGWFDPVCAIVMAVSSLMTAWCSYQNSKWGGQTGDLAARADKYEREAVALHLDARETRSAYLRLVMEVVDDKLDGREDQAEFYLARFPVELRTAWEKWMTLKPFEKGSAAPAHPFQPEFYTDPFDEKIRMARNAAHQAEDEARITGQTASSYLSNTVLLATVLFFAGTAGKFDQRRVRWASLWFALALFAYAAYRTISLPMA
jgi:hypothetical protein